MLTPPPSTWAILVLLCPLEHAHQSPTAGGTPQLPCGGHHEVYSMNRGGISFDCYRYFQPECTDANPEPLGVVLYLFYSRQRLMAKILNVVANRLFALLHVVQYDCCLALAPTSPLFASAGPHTAPCHFLDFDTQMCLDYAPRHSQDCRLTTLYCLSQQRVAFL